MTQIPVGSGRHHLGAHQVGGQALADPARVEPGAGGQADAVAVDLDVGRADPEEAVPGADVRPEQLEGTVVAGAEHGAEHRGLERAAR